MEQSTMSITQIDICNLALSRLGNRTTVENLDEPKKQEEKTFAKWYDISRKSALKLMLPSFAKTREIWAKVDGYKPAFGYDNAYKYKNDCVRILGVDNLDVKENDYSIEGEYLLTNYNFENGLPVRFIRDITDTSKFTADFIQLFSWLLAYDVCLEITKDRKSVV